MNTSDALITRLFSIRNRYGKQFALEKMQLLDTASIKTVKDKKAAQSCYATLEFLIAYPDNKTIYKLSNQLLGQLQEYIKTNENLKFSLYNTGITNTTFCAAFSFELVKWMRKTHPKEIKLRSLEADDAQIQSILSVVMPKTESEIFQDANAEWKSWLQHLKKQDEDLLDQFIAIFDSSDIRPEIKDGLWNKIGIYVEINFTSHCCLRESLTRLYYHRSLIRKEIKKQIPIVKPKRVKLTEEEAEQIIDHSRMIMLANLREIDPISYTTAKLVSYYHLPRGISIALMGMVPERRHPIDSYMGYMVFKNGLPVAYAGSWILFDSGRIGLNVFSNYRGGESKYIFEQVLELHRKVYRLKRFTVDPYQIGKKNSDGIHSGAFWIYYHSGFRPMQKIQRELATAEDIKIKFNSSYRSPVPILKTLANSRLELVLQKSAASFDATDLSRVYAGILAKKYNGNRSLAEKEAAKKLANLLLIKDYREDKMKFILKNWAILLLSRENELRNNSALKKVLKKLFIIKAGGSEEAYITGLQQAADLRKFIGRILKKYDTG
jgi:hypothetical protein